MLIGRKKQTIMRGGRMASFNLIVEGPDGTGKTTLVGSLSRELDMVPVKFPSRWDPRWDPRDPEPFLQDFERRLTGNLPSRSGLCFDRSYLSSLVHQGYRGGVEKPLVVRSIVERGRSAFERLGTRTLTVLMLSSTDRAWEVMSSRHGANQDEMEGLRYEEFVTKYDLLRSTWVRVLSERSDLMLGPVLILRNNGPKEALTNVLDHLQDLGMR
jgi:thymidylate kinase